MSPDRISPERASPDRIGYVLKMYPRFSETFVLTEILAREARGADIEIFSLRPPADPRFHADLARVQAPVTYVPRARKTEELWAAVRAAEAELPRLPEVLRELAAADVADAGQALELARTVRARGITHLHAHFASMATTVARLTSLLTGASYSFTAHAKDIFHADVDEADVATKIADAHHVVTISDYNAQFLAERYPEAVHRTVLHRIYNGLDLDAFTVAAPAERPAVPTVLGVGRLVEKKGFDVLVDAVGLLRARGRDLRCRIVGGGALEGALRAQVDRLGLADVVTLTGPLPQDRVRAEVRAADALAAPCVVGADGNADGLPTVLLEAMALGTPCISTDVTGIGEAVRDEVTGLRVPQHDAVALADALARLLDDDVLRRRLVDGARALVEEHFDSRAQAAALDAALRPAPGAYSAAGTRRAARRAEVA